MATKTFEVTIEVPESVLKLASADFDVQLDGELGRKIDSGLKEDAREWARGLWVEQVQAANEQTSQGEDVAHEGLRQPVRLPFAGE